MSKTRRWLEALGLALGLCLGWSLVTGAALAQQQVLTVPQPGSTLGGNVSSTVTTTNTFQKLFAAAGVPPTNRHGCTIINTGTHTEYVSEGLGVAASTTGNSVPLAPQQAYFCTVNGIVLTGEIDITGTAGDSFYAAQY